MMRAASLFVLPTGLSLLAFVSLASRQRLLGLCALALSALWVLLVGLKRFLRLRTPILVGATVLCGLAVFTGQPPLIAVLALTASIYGWDFSLTADSLAAFRKSAKGRFVVRYITLSSILAGLGIGLAAAAALWRTTLSFSPALGLAVGTLLVAVVLLRLARSTIETPDASEQ